MDFTDFFTTRFWEEWNRLLMRLPHDRQAEVLANPGGYEWKLLAAAAALAAE
jgi:hypothetical protein